MSKPGECMQMLHFWLKVASWWLKVCYMNDTILDPSHFCWKQWSAGSAWKAHLDWSSSINIMPLTQRVKNVPHISSSFISIPAWTLPSVCWNLPLTCSKRVMSLMIYEFSNRLPAWVSHWTAARFSPLSVDDLAIFVAVYVSHVQHECFFHMQYAAPKEWNWLGNRSLHNANRKCIDLIH